MAFPFKHNVAWLGKAPLLGFELGVRRRVQSRGNERIDEVHSRR
jgi:hypothetical protein